ncbi:hypothetical protein H2200_007205 [Cladophialophora chaetospira]|uniref:Yeast cell wall synthesis Kre9/Knh1-like N-terminal domain-containing protein n=1 Tax=Cladophialophora chaetospira TaxID=386627 RepID=A0AA39CHB2_9EURO|nr:hypothetical protein H2200_007205 [Cladophialophora chaetospira]
MLSRTFVLASLLAAASAIQITAPKLGDKWDLSGTNSVEWSSVSTDPTSFDIVIIDQGASPAKTMTLAKGVSTSAGKYDFSNFVFGPSNDVQINLTGNSQNSTGIIAQSQQFEVTKSGTAPSSTSSASGTATAATSASTATNTNSATKLGSTLGFALPALLGLNMLM